MKLIKLVHEMREYSKDCKKKGLTIGFVPTMGAFHKGHITLIQLARKENDALVVSIFVNPLQFCSGEDFDKYPRQLEVDKKIAEAELVDVLFVPSVAEIYPKGFDTYVDQSVLSQKLCGLFRLGHFRGVMTIVTKLFNIVQPDISYFGQKDYQQYLIIKRMAADLNIDTKTKLLPIIREDDGLAMSSRNVYLGPKQRKEAICLYEALSRARELINHGENDSSKVIREMKRIINKNKGIKVDYVTVANADSLEAIKEVKGRILIACAIRIGKTRLIDNILIE